MAVKDIFQTVLDDQDCLVIVFLDSINQIDCSLTGKRIQICERLIKEQNLDIIHHNAGESSALFLPSGKLKGRGIKKGTHINHVRNFLNGFFHCTLFNPVILQRKCDVFSDCQTDELSVRILQDCSDSFGPIEKIILRSVFTVNQKTSGNRTFIGKGNQSVNAMRESAFSASGRPDNQNFFSRINIQIDIVKCWFTLTEILKGKIPE